MYFSQHEDLENILNHIKRILCSIDNRQGVDVDIKAHKNKRTNQQNAFYWLNTQDIAEMLNGSGISYGDDRLPYTAELVHQITKKNMAVPTTKKLSTKEFCDFMDSFFALWISKTSGFWQPKESPVSYLERTGLLN